MSSVKEKESWSLKIDGCGTYITLDVKIAVRGREIKMNWRMEITKSIAVFV